MHVGAERSGAANRPAAGLDGSHVKARTADATMIVG